MIPEEEESLLYAGIVALYENEGRRWEDIDEDDRIAIAVVRPGAAWAARDKDLYFPIDGSLP